MTAASLRLTDHEEGGSASGILLVIDTCGERGSVALLGGEQLLGEQILPERMAAAALLPALRTVLMEAGLRVGELDVVGVVNGPGSFTGVRVGLAVAKGLCEGAGPALATVSRLAVLAEVAGLREGFAVLRAGRGELYVRDEPNGAEQMMHVADFLQLAAGKEVVCAEAEIAALLGGGIEARFVAISAKDAVGSVRKCLEGGGTASALADANYVRDEGAIYRRAGAPQ